MFSPHKSHYLDLVQARCGALHEVYAAQLGHMVGYMFSRVATPGLDDGEIKRQVERVMTATETRTSAKLDELRAAAPDGKCSIRSCDREADTYRWLNVRKGNGICAKECLLCLEHASDRDNNGLPSVDTLRPSA